MPVFVFAYGSLTLLQAAASEHHLNGFARCWGVAMDNRVDVDGYKYYVDQSGQRPAVSVAFLDLVASEDGAVNGALLAVDSADLDIMDRRERNYERVAVTDQVSPRPSGEVYAYVGSAAGRRRLTEGLAAGSCVIDATYMEAVREGFDALGPGALQRFDALTLPPPCPLVPLVRRDL